MYATNKCDLQKPLTSQGYALVMTTGFQSSVRPKNRNYDTLYTGDI